MDHTRELLIAIILILLFYIFVKSNNIIITQPNQDLMSNVSYQADDINDLNIDEYEDEDEMDN